MKIHWVTARYGGAYLMTASEADDRLGLEVPPEGTHVLFVGTDDDGVAVTGDLDFLQRFTTEIGDAIRAAQDDHGSGQRM